MEINSPETQIDLEDWDNKDFQLSRISLAGIVTRDLKIFHLEFDRRVTKMANLPIELVEKGSLTGPQVQ